MTAHQTLLITIDYQVRGRAREVALSSVSEQSA